MLELARLEDVGIFKEDIPKRFMLPESGGAMLLLIFGLIAVMFIAILLFIPLMPIDIEEEGGSVLEALPLARPDIVEDEVIPPDIVLVAAVPGLRLFIFIFFSTSKK